MSELVAGVMLSQRLINILEDLGLPKHCVSLDLRVRHDEFVTLTVTSYLPGPVIEVLTDELATATQEFVMVRRAELDRLNVVAVPADGTASSTAPLS